MSDEILHRAARLTDEGVPFALASVVARRAPASARPGARALVEADGSFHGWLGGSCIEPTIRREAARALDDGEPRLVVFTPDGEADRPGAVVHPMTCHSGGTVEVFVEPRLPAPVLALYGDSPVNRALAAMAPAAGWRVRALAGSDAGDWSGAEVLPRDGDPRGAGDAGGEATDLCAVVATMGEWDEDAVRRALDAGAGYVGLVASPKRAAAVRETVAATGADPGDRLVSPAGLDLGAREPGEIAVTILAELVERRRPAGGEAADPEEAPDAGAADVSAGDAAAGGGDGARDPEEAPDGGSVDPVCGMTVVDEDAPSVEHGGVVYRFCCPGCRARFEADPERFLAADGSA